MHMHAGKSVECSECGKRFWTSVPFWTSCSPCTRYWGQIEEQYLRLRKIDHPNLDKATEAFIKTFVFMIDQLENSAERSRNR